MNDLDRLRLLQTILAQARFDNTASLRSLASDSESLFDSIEELSRDTVQAFRELWTALEIIGWSDSERIRMLEAKEIADIEILVVEFASFIQTEISMRRNESY